MSIFAYMMRVIALAFLSAGSASIVFAAISLVKAAVARGMPIAEAAAANVPIFYMFSTVVLICSCILFVAECIDFVMKLSPQSLLVKLRYTMSMICVCCGLIWSLGIVPQMRDLNPRIKSDADAHEQFQKMHKMSEMDMSAVMVCALISLLLPGLEQRRSTADSSGKQEKAGTASGA